MAQRNIEKQREIIKQQAKKVSCRRYHLFLLEMEYIENHAATVCTVSCEIKPVIKKKLALRLSHPAPTSASSHQFYLRARKQHRHKHISRFLSFTLISHQTCWTYLHQTCVTKCFYQPTEKKNHRTSPGSVPNIYPFLVSSILFIDLFILIR